MSTDATGLPRRPAACPCGTGRSYDECCGRLHRGEDIAATAEALMRSRYSAYAVGELDYVFRTWHPRTRPADLVDPGATWEGLEVLRTEAGDSEDADGIVEFRARYRTATGPGTLEERSRFTRRRGRWVYVDAVRGPA